MFYGSLDRRYAEVGLPLSRHGGEPRGTRGGGVGGFGLVMRGDRGDQLMIDRCEWMCNRKSISPHEKMRKKLTKEQN